MRFIFNPYSQKQVLVKCGKCDACQQEKAMKRANRIRNNISDGTIPLFITLTYANDYVPYMLRSDLLSSDLECNVYRNADIRYVFNRHSNKFSLKKSTGVHPINRIIVESHLRNYSDINSLKSLNGLDNDKIGVCLFLDIQKFFKRLRQILIRHYNYAQTFSYFCCSEYGGHSQRPHFHALLFVPSAYADTFRSAVCEAWPYADKTRTSRFIEVARNAANYVASYVNSNSCLPSFMSQDSFKQKHSCSKHFGCLLDCFSLPKILQKINNGDLVYYCRQKFDGKSSTFAMPVPLYILHRYFPICKGFSWLAPSQLRTILLNPTEVGNILNDTEYQVNFNNVVYDSDFINSPLVPLLRLSNKFVVRQSCKLINPHYSFTPKESYQIYVRLENCYKKFHEKTGLSRYDYAFYYERCYKVYFSTIMRLMHDEENKIDYSDFYDNNFQVDFNRSIAPTLPLNLTIDPNKRKDIVSSTDTYRRLFSRMTKQKLVTNYCMDKMQLDV